MNEHQRQTFANELDELYGPGAGMIWRSEGGLYTPHYLSGNPVYYLGNGEMLAFLHSPDLCRGRSCVIHGPSEHHMRSWPTNYRYDRHIMERICPHGIGHPDPDDSEYRKTTHAMWTQTGGDVHGCDGCCNP